MPENRDKGFELNGYQKNESLPCSWPHACCAYAYIIDVGISVYEKMYTYLNGLTCTYTYIIDVGIGI